MELLNCYAVKAGKLAYYGTHQEETRELPGEKEIMQGTMPGARRRGRPRAAWMEESIRMTEDMGEWRKYVHGAANPRSEDG